MIDLAIVIPCFNEEAAIIDVLEALSHKLISSFCNAEFKIFVYDNNSTDHTVDVVKEYIEKNNASYIQLQHTYQQGKGYVIKQAFKEINAKCYCMIDGDNTYDVDNIFEMYELIKSHKADMVIGDRLSTSYFRENKRLFHNCGNLLVRDVINMLFNVKYKDILSGFRVFSYEFVKTFPITSGGFTLETEMNIHAAHYDMSVLDVPVSYKDRKEGSFSKLKTIPDGIKVVRKLAGMVRIYKPMLYYGTVSITLFILSFLFGLPVVIEYIKTGLVERFPTLIVCGFTIEAALLNLFMGQMETNNNLRNIQRFELLKTQIQISEVDQ